MSDIDPNEVASEAERAAIQAAVTPETEPDMLLFFEPTPVAFGLKWAHGIDTIVARLCARYDGEDHEHLVRVIRYALMFERFSLAYAAAFAAGSLGKEAIVSTPNGYAAANGRALTVSEEFGHFYRDGHALLAEVAELFAEPSAEDVLAVLAVIWFKKAASLKASGDSAWSDYLYESTTAASIARGNETWHLSQKHADKIKAEDLSERGRKMRASRKPTPASLAKDAIKPEWLAWLNGVKEYPSESEFIRVVLDRHYPAVVRDNTVRDWIKEWKSELPSTK